MKSGVRTALGLLLSALLLWWALRGVNIAEVGGALRAANLPMLALAALMATAVFPLRALRWRPILHPVEPNLPFGPLWRATAIGVMVTNTVPLRLGELARAYALTRETRVPFSAAFASIAVDRVFDAVVVLALLSVAWLDPALGAGQMILGRPISMVVGGAALVAAAGLIGLYVIVFFPAQLVAIFQALTRPVSARTAERGADLLVKFASGLGVLRQPGRFFTVLAWATAFWVLNGFAFWVGFRAVGIDVPISAAYLVQGFIAMGVALPQAPAFVGTFHFFGREGLALYGVDPTLAVTWAIGFHLLSFIPITLIGLVYFLRLGLHFRELRDPQAAATSADPAAVPARTPE